MLDKEEFNSIIQFHKEQEFIRKAQKIIPVLGLAAVLSIAIGIFYESHRNQGSYEGRNQYELFPTRCSNQHYSGGGGIQDLTIIVPSDAQIDGIVKYHILYDSTKPESTKVDFERVSVQKTSEFSR